MHVGTSEGNGPREGAAPAEPGGARSGPAGGPEAASARGPRGALVAIGGAEDKVGDRAVLSEFVARSGGPRATIADHTSARWAS